MDNQILIAHGWSVDVHGCGKFGLRVESKPAINWLKGSQPYFPSRTL